MSINRLILAAGWLRRSITRTQSVTFVSTLIGACREPPSLFFARSEADYGGGRISSRPGEASQPYVLQTTFPTRELTDLGETIKQAGLLGSVVVQRPT